MPKKILFFALGMFPTKVEKAAAAEIGATAFRNSRLVSDKLEKCDIAAGAVPEGYDKMEGVEVMRKDFSVYTDEDVEAAAAEAAAAEAAAADKPSAKKSK